MVLRSLFTIGILASGLACTFAADGPQTPDEAAKGITLPPGFHATLFAGEPDVVQPMSITFDDRGRLWVVECRSYPKWLSADAKEGNDRILILEDGDGDGRFDHKKVFLDKGVNFSSVEYGFGGIFVTAIPNLLFIPDANGDDVPDGPAQVLLDGWDLKAVHNVVNSLTWGPDGWLYGCNGILSNSRVGKPGTPDADRVPMNCGIWRYHPVRRQFEVVAHGTTNPWGLAFDDRGEAFLTNCVIEHAFHVVPGARFKRMFGQDFNPRTFELMQTCADHIHWAGGTWEGSRNATGKHGEAGGGHAHSGAMIYRGEQFPPDYNNCLLTLNIHGQRLNCDKLTRHRSGYVAEHRSDFAQSHDPWFRGVCVRQSPDGSIYFTDWSDTGECHNYDDATIHRENGRIYRVAFGEAKPKERPVIGKDVAGAITMASTYADGVVREHARRWLQEQASVGRPVVIAPEALHRSLFGKPQEAPAFSRLELLWVAHATGSLTEPTRMSLLDDPDDTIRGWTIRLELEDKDASPQMLAKLQDMAKSDPSMYVQLQLASGLQRLPLDKRGEIARRLVARSDAAADNNLTLMVWYGIEPLVSRSDEEAMQLASAIRIPKLRQFVARHLATNAVPRFEPLIAWLGLDRGSVPIEKPEEIQRDILAGMYSGLEGRRDLKLHPEWIRLAARLAMSRDQDVRELNQLISLVQGSDTAFDYFAHVTTNASLDPELRRRAVTALVTTRRAAVADLLLKSLDDPALQESAIRGLAGFDRNEVTSAILGRYARLSESAKLDAISTLTAREKTALGLVKAVDAGTINKRDLSEFDIRQLQRFKEPQLKQLVDKLFGAKPSSAERAKQIAEMKSRIHEADLSTAKAGRGRTLFQRNCATCHTLFGVGRQVGPDLTGAQRTDLDYVLVNVMDPSALVGHAYRVTVVELKDGRVISGIVKADDDNTLTLETATDRIVVAKPDIEDRQQQPVSMMPEGLLNRLTIQEIRDLVTYLASPNQVPLE